MNRVFPNLNLELTSFALPLPRPYATATATAAWHQSGFDISVWPAAVPAIVQFSAAQPPPPAPPNGPPTGGSGNPQPPKDPEGPINPLKEVWKFVFKHLPTPWARRLAWAVPVTGLLATAYVFAVPEEDRISIAPLETVQTLIQSLWLDVDELKARAQEGDKQQALQAIETLAQRADEDSLFALHELKDSGVFSEVIEETLNEVAEDSGWIMVLQNAGSPQEKIEAIQGLQRIGGSRVIDVLVEAFDQEISKGLQSSEDYAVRAQLKLAIHRTKHLYWPVVAEEFLDVDRDQLLWEAQKLHDQTELTPQNSELWAQLRKVYQALGDDKQADAFNQKAKELSTQPQQGELTNARVAVEANHYEGVQAFQQEEFDSAANHFQAALAIDPQFYQAWVDLGGVYLEQRDFTAAAEAYQQAHVLLQEPRAEVSFSLARSYLAQEEYGLAILMLEEGIQTAKQQDPVPREDLAKAYQAYGTALSITGKLDLAFEAYENARKTYEELSDLRGATNAKSNTGTVYLSKGDYPKAEAIFLECLPAYQNIGDVHGVAQTQGNLGLTYYRWRKFDLALQHLQHSAEKFRQQDNAHGVSHAWNNISMVLIAQNNVGEAKDILERNLALKTQLDDRAGKALVLGNLGNLYVRMGDWDAAITSFQGAIALFESVGDHHSLAQSHLNLAGLFQKRSDPGTSRQLATRALRVFESIDDTLGVVNALTTLGVIAIGLKDFEEGIDLYEEGLEKLESTEIPDKRHKAILTAQLHNNLGLAYLDQGQNEKALGHFETSVEIYETLNNHRLLADVYNNLGLLYLKSDSLDPDHSLALAQFEKALKIHRETKNHFGVAQASLNIGVVFAKQGKFDLAMKHAREAQEIFTRLGAKDFASRAHSLYRKAESQKIDQLRGIIRQLP